MPEGQQVMSDVHTVVVVNGSQLGQFLKILPSTGKGVEKERNHLFLKLGLMKSYYSYNYF